MSTLNPQTLFSEPLDFASNLRVPSTWRGDETKRGRDEGQVIVRWKELQSLVNGGWLETCVPNTDRVCAVLSAAARECDSRVHFLPSFLFLQELIEVDSDVVFELASYILQVSKVILLFVWMFHTDRVFSIHCSFSPAVKMFWNYLTLASKILPRACNLNW